MSDGNDQTPAELGPLRLDLLFAESPALDLDRLLALVRAYDADLADARAQPLSEAETDERALLLRVSGHTVLVHIIETPLPEVLVEPCIQLAHYEEDEKDRARAHQAVVSVHYVGACDSPFVAHVVLASIAGALASLGPIAVVNLRARTSVPIGLLAKSHDRMIEYLHAMPSLLIYSGFAKYVVEGAEGVWMRTHGNAALGVPDFAHHARGHEDGQAIFALFSDMMLYLRDGTAAMSPGDVAQIGEDQFTLLRAPSPDETFLDQDDGPLLVVEVLDQAQLAQLRN